MGVDAKQIFGQNNKKNLNNEKVPLAAYLSMNQ